MNCWSCGAANDLETAQTCAACGAPLVKSRAVFSKPVLWGIVILALLLQGVLHPSPALLPMTPPAAFTLDVASVDVLRAAIEKLERGFSSLPPVDPGAPDAAAMEGVLLEAAERLKDNFPYFHPLYAGQMLKPPHPVARLAYALAMWINPNNHALDGGRASSAMEREAVAGIARMFGWGADQHLGHLCGGGTMANLEALWVAGRLHPGQAVLASSQAHYTHRRVGGVLGLPFEEIACDARGRMDAGVLARRLEKGGVGTVVATMGTTATGSVDPLPEILALRERHGFRLHADAAYGGYYGLADNLGAPARAAFDRIGEADSIVIDPHKHGLQPYGCGCVLFRDPAVGRLYKHDSPYTYFSSTELHLGEISLECSRPGRERRGALGDDAPAAAREGRRVRAAAVRIARGGARALTRGSRPTRASWRRSSPSSTSSSGRCGGGRRERVLRPRAARLRRGGAPRSAPRARGAARRVLRPRGCRDRARPRDHHVPALGADEARAPRVAGPDLDHPRRRGGSACDERAGRRRPRPAGTARRPRVRARDRDAPRRVRAASVAHVGRDRRGGCARGPRLFRERARRALRSSSRSPTQSRSASSTSKPCATISSAKSTATSGSSP